MQVIVIGGSGFLGSHVADQLSTACLRRGCGRTSAWSSGTSRTLSILIARR